MEKQIDRVSSSAQGLRDKVAGHFLDFLKLNCYNIKMSTYTIPINQTSATNITLTAGGSGSGSTYGPIYTTASTWSNPSPSKIEIKGDAVFEGNIKWLDRDMREWFESVESRLAILQPNTKLEAEYEELADLRRQYIELEKKLLEKQQIFDILKKPVD